MTDVAALKNRVIEETQVANATADTNTRSGRRVSKETSSEAEEIQQKLRRQEFALDLGLKLQDVASRYTVEVDGLTGLRKIIEIGLHEPKASCAKMGRCLSGNCVSGRLPRTKTPLK